MDGSHVLAEVPQTLLEYLPLSFYFLVRSPQSCRVLNSLLPRLPQLVLQAIQLLYLPLLQTSFLVGFVSPEIGILQGLGSDGAVEDVLGKLGSIKKVAIYSWEHGVEDLLEVIIELCLSLSSVGADAVLDSGGYTRIRSISKFILSRLGSSEYAYF